MTRTDRLRGRPAGSGTLPRGLGRTRGAAAERKKLMEDCEPGPSPLSGAVLHARNQPGGSVLRPAAVPAASDGAQR